MADALSTIQITRGTQLGTIPQGSQNIPTGEYFLVDNNLSEGNVGSMQSNLQLSPADTPTFYGLSASNQRITSVNDPVAASDAATKSYVDAAINGLDWQESVIDELATPPGSPSTGDRYIIIATATGAWAGNENSIAEWNGSSWTITAPDDGTTLEVEDTGFIKIWNGSSWVRFGSSIDHGNLQGLADDDHLQYVHLSNARTISAAHTWSGAQLFSEYPTINKGGIGRLYFGGDGNDYWQLDQADDYMKLYLNGNLAVRHQPTASFFFSQTFTESTNFTVQYITRLNATAGSGVGQTFRKYAEGTTTIQEVGYIAFVPEVNNGLGTQTSVFKLSTRTAGANRVTFSIDGINGANFADDVTVGDNLIVQGNGTTIAGGSGAGTWANGWIRLGSASDGLAIDDNEIVGFGDHLYVTAQTGYQTNLGAGSDGVGIGGTWTNNTVTSLDQWQMGSYSLGGNGLLIKGSASADLGITFSQSASSYQARIIYQHSALALKIFQGSDISKGIHLTSSAITNQQVTIVNEQLRVNKSQDHLQFQESGTSQFMLMSKTSQNYRFAFYDDVNDEFVANFGTDRIWDFTRQVNFVGYRAIFNEGIKIPYSATQDGQSIIFGDTDGIESGRITVNDGNANFAITSGIDGAGASVSVLDGISKINLSGNGEVNGTVSLNAGIIGASTFNIGILVDSSSQSLRIGNPGNKVGLDGTEGYMLADKDGDLYAQENLRFEAATADMAIVYNTSEGGGQGRRALTMDGVNDIVALSNRAPNGVVQIRANTATGGAAGEVTVAEYQDDLITHNVYSRISGQNRWVFGSYTSSTNHEAWIAKNASNTSLDIVSGYGASTLTKIRFGIGNAVGTWTSRVELTDTLFDVNVIANFSNYIDAGSGKIRLKANGNNGQVESLVDGLILKGANGFITLKNGSDVNLAQFDNTQIDLFKNTEITGTLGVSGVTTLNNRVNFSQAGTLAVVGGFSSAITGEQPFMWYKNDVGADRQWGVGIYDDSSLRNYIQLFEGNNPVNQRIDLGLDGAYKVRLNRTSLYVNDHLIHLYRNATIGTGESPTVANAGLQIQDSGQNMYLDGNAILTDGIFQFGTIANTDLLFFRNSVRMAQFDSAGFDILTTTNITGGLHVARSGSQLANATFLSTDNNSYINVGGGAGFDSGVIFTEGGDATTPTNRRYMVGYDESADYLRIYQYYKRDGVTNVSANRAYWDGNGNMVQENDLRVNGDTVQIQSGSVGAQFLAQTDGTVAANLRLRSTTNWLVQSNSVGDFVFYNESATTGWMLFDLSATQIVLQQEIRATGIAKIEGRTIIGENATPNSWNNTVLDVKGSVFINGHSLIYGQQGENNNVDHIWHDDNTNSNTGTGGTFHFSSDTTYKASGNSTVYAGALWMTRTNGKNYLGSPLGIGTTDPLTHHLYVNGTSAFSGAIGSVSFTSGFSGSGWQLRQQDSLWQLDVDAMTIRTFLRAYELIIEQVRYQKGSRILGPGGFKVASVSGTGPAEVAVAEDPNGTNATSMAVGDICLVQQYNPNRTTLIKYVVREVASISGTSVTFQALTGAPSDTGSIEAGDEVVAVGNTSDTSRQSVIYETVTDSGAPFTRVMTGIDSWAAWTGQDKVVMQTGNLSNVRTSIFGDLTGYGIWSKNAYFDGNAQIAGTITAGDSNGLGQTFVAGKLKVNLLPNSATVFNKQSHSSVAVGVESTYTNITSSSSFLGQQNPNVRRVRTGTSQGSQSRFGIAGGGLRTTELPAMDVEYIYSFYVYIPDDYVGSTSNSWVALQYNTSSNWQGTSIEVGNDISLPDFSKRDEWQRIYCRFKPTQALVDAGNTYVHVMYRWGSTNVVSPDDTYEIYVTGGQLELNNGTNHPSIYQENYKASNATQDPTFADPYTSDQYDDAYGMWSVFGGFGGTRYNPIVELGNYGFQIKNADNIHTTALTANSIMVGNITGTANSGIKITNTGTNSTSGIYGYTSAGNESFALRLDGTASISSWDFDQVRLTSPTNGVYLGSGLSGVDGINRVLIGEWADNTPIIKAIGNGVTTFVQMYPAGPNLFQVRSLGTDVMKVTTAGVVTFAGWTATGTNLNNGQVYIGTGLSSLAAAERILIGQWSAGIPIIRAYGGDTNNHVSLRADTDNDPWGLTGVLAGTAIFELGSTNQIANWIFTENSLYNTFTNGGAFIYSDNTAATASWNGDGTEQGVPTMAVYHSYNGSTNNRVYIHMGETYSNGWTGRYGFSFTPGKSNNAYVEFSRDMITGALTAQIASWNFNETTFYNGTDIVLDSANKRIALNNNAMSFGYDVGGSGNHGIYLGANDYWYSNFNGSLGGGIVNWTSSLVNLAGFKADANGIYDDSVTDQYISMMKTRPQVQQTVGFSLYKNDGIVAADGIKFIRIGEISDAGTYQTFSGQYGFQIWRGTTSSGSEIVRFDNTGAMIANWEIKENLIESSDDVTGDMRIYSQRTTNGVTAPQLRAYAGSEMIATMGMSFHGDGTTWLEGSMYGIQVSDFPDTLFMVAKNIGTGNQTVNGETVAAGGVYAGISSWRFSASQIYKTFGTVTAQLGELFTDNFGFRMYDSSNSDQINFRYDSAANKMEILAYDDASNYVSMGHSFDSSYTGMGFQLRAGGNNVILAQSSGVQIAGWNATNTQFSSPGTSGSGNGSYSTAGININSTGWISTPYFYVGTAHSGFKGRLEVEGLLPNDKLKGWWTFDSVRSDGNFEDLTGNGYHARRNNNGNASETHIASRGMMGRAFYNADGVWLMDHDDVHLDTKQTWVVRFKVNGSAYLGNDERLLSRDASDYFALRINGAQTQPFTTFSLTLDLGASVNHSITNASADVWYTFALVWDYDANTQAWYMYNHDTHQIEFENTATVSMGPSTANDRGVAIAGNVETATIGANGFIANTTYFDEVRYYNTTLTRGQLQYLFLNPYDRGLGTRIMGSMIRTGVITSSNYTGLTGNYATAGMMIDLDNDAIYGTHFSIQNGSGYFKGSINIGSDYWNSDGTGSVGGGIFTWSSSTVTAAGWTVISDAIYKSVGGTHVIIGSPDNVPSAWTSAWDHAFSVGTSGSDRIWLGSNGSGYEFAVYDGGSYIVRLGSTVNTIAGWTIDSTAIYSGTKDTTDYTTTGITISSAGGGSLHAQNFYIDTAGNAYFKGTLSSPVGTIGGLTLAASSLSASNGTGDILLNATRLRIRRDEASTLYTSINIQNTNTFSTSALVETAGLNTTFEIAESYVNTSSISVSGSSAFNNMNDTDFAYHARVYISLPTGSTVGLDGDETWKPYLEVTLDGSGDLYATSVENPYASYDDDSIILGPMPTLTYGTTAHNSDVLVYEIPIRQGVDLQDLNFIINRGSVGNTSSGEYMQGKMRVEIDKLQPIVELINDGFQYLRTDQSYFRLTKGTLVTKNFEESHEDPIHAYTNGSININGTNIKFKNIPTSDSGLADGELYVYTTGGRKYLCLA